MIVRQALRRVVVAACAVTGVATGLGAGGCGSPDALARPVAVTASTSATASATGSAAPSPSPSVDKSALQARAKAAAIAAKGVLSALGVSGGPKDEKAVAYDVTAACGKRTEADRTDVHAAYNRTWSAQGWWISNTAYAYATATGSDVVGQVKAAVESCPTYTGSEGAVTLHGAVDLPAYRGVDASYGFCQTSKRPDSTFVSCLAFVAKGSLVSSVWTVHGSSRSDNAAGVKQVAAIAAEALRNAS